MKLSLNISLRYEGPRANYLILMLSLYINNNNNDNIDNIRSC